MLSYEEFEAIFFDKTTLGKDEESKDEPFGRGGPKVSTNMV